MFLAGSVTANRCRRKKQNKLCKYVGRYNRWAHILVDNGTAQTGLEILHVRQYCELAKSYVNCDAVQNLNVASS
jgi:hypothetical protein